MRRIDSVLYMIVMSPLVWMELIAQYKLVGGVRVRAARRVAPVAHLLR